MQISKIVTLLGIFFALWLSSNLGQAAPFLEMDGTVYGHKSPNGTISFYFTETSSGGLFGPLELQGVSIHKAFLSEGREFYYLYANVQSEKLQKKPVKSFTLTIGEKSYPLSQLDGTTQRSEKDYFSAFYALPDEAIHTFESAKKIGWSFNLEDGSIIKHDTTAGRILGALRELKSVSKDQYVREGKILDASRDASKDIFTRKSSSPILKWRTLRRP